MIVLVQSRRIAIVAAGLVLVAGACGGNDIPDTGTEPTTVITGTQTTGTTRAPAGDTTSSDGTTTSEPTETTTTVGETDEPSTITSDELCELLPTVEIGVEMDARRDVTTFASPSGASSICTLSIFTGEKTVYMSVELVSNGGDASFEAEAGFVASIYGDAFEIEGVGDRAVGFENSAIQVLVLAGQSVVRIIWPTEEPYSLEQAGEIGRLVAAALR